MKTEVIIKEKKKRGLKFPLLAKSLNGALVLFSSEKEGTVLGHLQKELYPIGHYSNEWTSVFDRDTWEILKGEVTIKFNTEL